MYNENLSHFDGTVIFFCDLASKEKRVGFYNVNYYMLG
jgi:hypothetical protein